MASQTIQNITSPARDCQPADALRRSQTWREYSGRGGDSDGYRPFDIARGAVLKMKMRKQARKARKALQEASSPVDDENPPSPQKDVLEQPSDADDTSTVASSSWSPGTVSARTSDATSLRTSNSWSCRGASDFSLQVQEVRGSLPVVAEESVPARPELSAVAVTSLALSALALGALAKGRVQDLAIFAVPALTLASHTRSTDGAALIANGIEALEPLQSAALPLAALSVRCFARQRDPIKAATLGLPALLLAATAHQEAVGTFSARLGADACAGKLDGLAAMLGALAVRALARGGDVRAAGAMILPAAAVAAFPRQRVVQKVFSQFASVLARILHIVRVALRSATAEHAHAAAVALGALACRSIVRQRNISLAAVFGLPAALLVIPQLEESVA